MLVKKGVSTVNEMKRQLKIIVKHEIFDNTNVPPTSNRRYFPNPRIIRSHMAHAKRSMRHSMIDQECLTEKVKQWKEEQPNCRIFYRPTTVVSGDEHCTDDTEEDFDEDECDKEIKRLLKRLLSYSYINLQSNKDCCYATEMKLPF